jgi:hypothetical protein
VLGRDHLHSSDTSERQNKKNQLLKKKKT